MSPLLGPPGTMLHRLTGAQQARSGKGSNKQGVHSQYGVQNATDRWFLDQQLGENVQRGYLKEDSITNDLCPNHLLLSRRPKGMFYCMNDFKKLNEYFPWRGMTTKLMPGPVRGISSSNDFFPWRSISNMVFSILMYESLMWPFGFTHGIKRYSLAQVTSRQEIVLHPVLQEDH